jgi:inorganic pyrophosphatase
MDTYDIIIETPKGSSEKYSLDKDTGYFKLKKLLPPGMMFPYDFGIIPDTEGEDGDPLDALVVSEFRSFPGCLIECRLIGAILAEQSESGKTRMMRNDRFFFVPQLSKQFKEVEKIKDVPGIDEIGDFFIHYNKEQGKDFKILEVIDTKKAAKIIRESMEK